MSDLVAFYLVRLGPAIALSLAVGIALIPAASRAQGSEPPSRARIHFEAGRVHFEAGRYDLAITEFEASYAIEPRDELLYNLYLAHERLSHLDQAIDALERFLPSVSDAETRTRLEERLQNLRARRDAERAEEVTPPQPPPPPTAPASSGGVHPAGVAVLIGAGVLLVSFAVFAGLSEAEDGALTARCGTSCVSSDVGALTAYNVVADVSWIGAALAGAAGLVLIFALPPERAAPSTARLVPWGSPDGAGLTIAGAF